MIVRTPPERPVELAVRRLDWVFIDTGETALHVAIRVELPILVAISTKPLPAVVAILVGIAHRDTVPIIGPKLFDQAVVELLSPFPG